MRRLDRFAYVVNRHCFCVTILGVRNTISQDLVNIRVWQRAENGVLMGHTMVRRDLSASLILS